MAEPLPICLPWSESTTSPISDSATKPGLPEVPITESSKQNIEPDVPSSSLSNLSLEAHEMGSASGPGRESTEAKFIYFSNLPVELRLKIWSFVAVEPPRIVTGLHFRQGHQAFKSVTHSPTVMRVCRESREVGSKVFSLILEAESKSFPSARLYVNPKLDTVYYCDRSTPRYGGTCKDFFLATLAALVGSEKTNEIRHVMYEVSPSAMRRAMLDRSLVNAPDNLDPLVKSYRNLKSVTLIVNDSQYKWEGNKYLAIETATRFGAPVCDRFSNPRSILLGANGSLAQLNAKFPDWQRPTLKTLELTNNLEGSFEDIINQGRLEFL